MANSGYQVLQSQGSTLRNTQGTGDHLSTKTRTFHLGGNSFKTQGVRKGETTGYSKGDQKYSILQASSLRQEVNNSKLLQEVPETNQTNQVPLSKSI